VSPRPFEFPCGVEVPYRASSPREAVCPRPSSSVPNRRSAVSRNGGLPGTAGGTGRQGGRAQSQTDRHGVVRLAQITSSSGSVLVPLKAKPPLWALDSPVTDRPLRSRAAGRCWSKGRSKLGVGASCCSRRTSTLRCFPRLLGGIILAQRLAGHVPPLTAPLAPQLHGRLEFPSIQRRNAFKDAICAFQATGAPMTRAVLDGLLAGVTVVMTAGNINNTVATLGNAVQAAGVRGVNTTLNDHSILYGDCTGVGAMLVRAMLWTIGALAGPMPPMHAAAAGVEVWAMVGNNIQSQQVRPPALPEEVRFLDLIPEPKINQLQIGSQRETLRLIW
jgi:hypothetical protein